MFKAEKFDANKWVELFKKAGAIIGELAEATRKQGLIFRLSSHPAEHW